MAGVKTRALILRCSDYGDSDRIVSLLSEDFGKIRGIARGARRSLKRFGGCLEPFTLINLVLKQRKGLSLLQEGRVARDFREIKGDIEKISYGSYILELTDSMVAEGVGGREGGAFNLLLGGIETLAGSARPEEAVREYEVRILRMTGYMPSFLNCAACGREVINGGDAAGRSGTAFSRSRGGVICSGCPLKDGETTDFISPGTLRTLEAAAVRKVSFTRHVLEESERVIPLFIAHHLGKRLKSLEFIEKMKGL